jgi:hypothetical protein
MQFIGNARFRDIDSGPDSTLFSWVKGAGKPNTTTLKRKRCDKSAA